MSDQERILITVRTYPTISKEYVETVCTGGINESGEWRRLYPVPLRYLEEDRQFRTYDIVRLKLRPGADGRPETRRPMLETVEIEDHLKHWQSRCDWVNPTIHSSLAEMKEKGRTLAPVAVREVLEFTAEPCDPEWTPEQKDILKQELMFDRLALEKIPYNFRVRWIDQDGDENNSLIIAWELRETWRQYRRQYPDPIPKMREK
ncbi:MAG: hypothetical protein FWC56_00515 [Phycisphaerae bacterium]|nr:hypothetical protein [Phycisphaerae bacterium]